MTVCITLPLYSTSSERREITQESVTSRWTDSQTQTGLISSSNATGSKPELLVIPSRRGLIMRSAEGGRLYSAWLASLAACTTRP